MKNGVGFGVGYQYEKISIIYITSDATCEMQRPDRNREPRHLATEVSSLMMTYHQSMIEYHVTTASILRHSANINMVPLSNENVYDNYGYYYHQNVRDYNRITESSLQLLRDMYITPPVVSGDTPTPAPTNADLPPPVPRQETPQVVTRVPSRPTTFISYNLYPLFPPALEDEQANIIMTEEQIRDHTQEFAFTHDISATTCPITLEDFSIGEQLTRINACGHIFKSAPLRQWFRRNSRCPVCRRNVVLNETAPVYARFVQERARTLRSTEPVRRDRAMSTGRIASENRIQLLSGGTEPDVSGNPSTTAYLENLIHTLANRFPLLGSPDSLGTASRAHDLSNLFNMHGDQEIEAHIERNLDTLTEAFLTYTFEYDMSGNVPTLSNVRNR
jgi:alkanesulfonate monooxygenase SsuD/methylene tetrahydromethanopterin reductase-like flavin-dependent oxidoreductase (luciferase family)